MTSTLLPFKSSHGVAAAPRANAARQRSDPQWDRGGLRWRDDERARCSVWARNGGSWLRCARLDADETVRGPTERTVRAMRVLTVYAHPNPTSFCHAVLEQFTRGLDDAGHTNEVVDLYAIKFDPVFSRDDYSFFAHESVPPELFDETELRESMVTLSGGPIRRRVAKRWLRDKSLPELLEVVAKQRPKDVLAQQEKVAAADGLAFVAPIFWMNFPAILRGWMERVFTYGFVYTMTEGRLAAGRSERQAAVAEAQEGADHDADLLPGERLSRVRVRRGDRAAGRRLRLPLPGDRERRARLLLRGRRRRRGDPAATTCSGPTGSGTSSSRVLSRHASPRASRNRSREV